MIVDNDNYNGENGYQEFNKLIINFQLAMVMKISYNLSYNPIDDKAIGL